MSRISIPSRCHLFLALAVSITLTEIAEAAPRHEIKQPVAVQSAAIKLRGVYGREARESALRKLLGELNQVSGRMSSIHQASAATMTTELPRVFNEIARGHAMLSEAQRILTDEGRVLYSEIGFAEDSSSRLDSEYFRLKNQTNAVFELLTKAKKLLTEREDLAKDAGKLRAALDKAMPRLDRGRKDAEEAATVFSRMLGRYNYLHQSDKNTLFRMREAEQGFRAAIVVFQSLPERSKRLVAVTAEKPLDVGGIKDRQEANFGRLQHTAVELLGLRTVTQSNLTTGRMLESMSKIMNATSDRGHARLRQAMSRTIRACLGHLRVSFRVADQGEIGLRREDDRAFRILGHKDSVNFAIDKGHMGHMPVRHQDHFLPNSHFEQNRYNLQGPDAHKLNAELRELSASANRLARVLGECTTELRALNAQCREVESKVTNLRDRAESLKDTDTEIGVTLPAFLADFGDTVSAVKTRTEHFAKELPRIRNAFDKAQSRISRMEQEWGRLENRDMPRSCG